MLFTQKTLALSLVAATGLVMTVAASPQTVAQAPQPAKPKGQAQTATPGARARPGLSLTQAQRAEIRTFREAQRPEVRVRREKMRAARAQLRQAITADVPDEAAIRAAAGALAELQADEAVLQARTRAHIMSVLTPEQQAQWKGARTRMAERAQRLRLRLGRMMRQESGRPWRGGR